MFRLIYHFLILPLGLTLALILSLFGNKKIKSILTTRFRRQNNKKKPDKIKKMLWFHCASGEFEYAKPVIRSLKKKYPHKKILVTYLSPTYVKNIESNPLVDQSHPLPLDFVGAIRDFLNHFQPEILFIARTDLWPELLQQCKKNGIRRILFSCSLPNAPVFFKKIWLKYTMSQLDHIYCVTDHDKLHLSQLNISTPISTIGDTRYDQVFYRLDHPKNYEKKWFNSSSLPLFIAGSTWNEDEEVILSPLLQLVKQNKIRLCIAPHEPTTKHINQLKDKIKTKAVDFELYSSPHTESKPVMIVNTVGILADLYKEATWAFIGNSFKYKVHSVMEAIGAGCISFVGPKHYNNREALIFKEESLEGLSPFHILNEFNSSEELTQALETQLQLELTLFRPDIKNKALALCGATPRLIQHAMQ